MRRTGGILLFLLLPVGCSDPAASRLNPGDEAIVYNATYDVLLLGDTDRTFAIPAVKVGTHVVVVSDDSEEREPRRRVRIRVREGKLADQVGTLQRDDLRPL